jgi:hypothetical protein
VCLSLAHQPLAFVSVFLVNTTRWATTTAPGHHTLGCAPLGRYGLATIYLGSQWRHSVEATHGTAININFLPVAQLSETVARPSPNRLASYHSFLELLLGASIANRCWVRCSDAVQMTYAAEH